MTHIPLVDRLPTKEDRAAAIADFERLRDELAALVKRYAPTPMTAEELLKKIEAEFRASGGHCGESTSEKIARQSWEREMATAMSVMRRFMK